MYTRHDAEGRQEALPTHAPPPRSDRPPLTEADVRRLIADAVGQPPRVAPTQVRPITQQPTANAADDAVRPLPVGPPPPTPTRLAKQPTPPSRSPDLPQPKGQGAAPELQHRRPMAPADSPKPKTAGADRRGSRLRRRLPTEAKQAPSPHPGRSPTRPTPASGVAGAPRSEPPECPPSTGVELSKDLMEIGPLEADQHPAPADAQAAPAANPQQTTHGPAAPPGPRERPESGPPGAREPHGRTSLGMVRRLPLVVTPPLRPLPLVAFPPGDQQGHHGACPRRWSRA